jgi:hypothetical protein
MLIFVLKRRWFELIKSGEKTIEYREIKDYWTARLINAYYYNTKDINDGLRHWIERCCDIEDGAGLYTGFFDYIKDGLICDIPCKLRLGYTNKYLFAKIVRIEIIDGEDTDLAIDKPVYAIHLTNVEEL